MNNKLRGDDFWGKGIPNFEKEDLMSKKEILDFCIEIVLQFGTKSDGYSIVSVDNKINANPNIILEKEEQLYYVLVRGTEVHRQPAINEEEKEQLIEVSKEKNAIPLFASVGIGSMDPERFDAELLLRNDGFYANFTGYEKIGIMVEETKLKKEVKPKTNKNVVKKEIGSLYVHFLNENNGYYNSFRNYCCNKMVFFSFLYGRNGTHICSTPDKYKISEESSNKIRKVVEKEYENLVQISKDELDNLESYISIVYIDDTTEYFKFDEKISEAFELREKIKEGFDVISEPYLIFNDNNYNRNVKKILSLCNSIKEKKIDDIFGCLDFNFAIKFDFKSFNKTIINISDLKKLYKKFAGFFGIKLASHYIFITKLGVLEDGKSKVNIGVEISGKKYKIKCVCNFKFNEENKVSNIIITECGDLYRAGKILTDDDILKIINGKYSDFNN